MLNIQRKTCILAWAPYIDDKGIHTKIEIQKQCDNWEYNGLNFRCTEFGMPRGVHI